MRTDHRLLVCGGRDYKDYSRLYAVLDRALNHYADRLIIIHGAADGADLMAENWAKQRQVEYRGYPARWFTFKNAAGIIRNKHMRDHSQPHSCVAFPGGTGTLNMCTLMREIGIEPVTIDWKLPPAVGDLYAD